MAERNEADALFATKRKKQQEEQAEQERREEMSRKKAEMEAEIRRLEEEARRQKEQQEEARRQAQEEARRASEEAKEAEARAARAEEMAKQAQLKEEERRAREKKEAEERRAREKKEEEKRARERAAQEKAQAKRQEAQKAENRKQEVRKREVSEKKREKKSAGAQPGKKFPILPVAIGGGAAVVAVIVICLVLFLGGKKGGVFGTDCNVLASEQVLNYVVYYPESFEEGYGDGGVFLDYGSAEKEDYSFVYILGDTREGIEEMAGSTDPSDVLLMLGYTLGVDAQLVYEMTTDSGLTVYGTGPFYQDVSGLVYTEEDEVMAEVSIMLLPFGDDYLVALYGTMKDSYMEPLEEAVTSILDNVH